MSDVSLTTTLQPGVTLVSASLPPVQNGQQLTWDTGRLGPLGTLTGRNQQLRRLGTRPLGAFLFRDPGLRRDEVRVVRDASGHWGRRSRFLLRGRPLLVAEYFLPALLNSAP